MNIQYNPEGHIITVTLPETVDANNQEEIKEEISSVISRYENDDRDLFLYLDALDTKYISSAGIRVILLLRPKVENIAIINVHDYLYEVLAITGMSNAIIILPPIREISLENCSIIAGGLNSKVYRIDEDKICKLFESKNTLEDVIREKQMSLEAVQYGLPTALSFEVVTCGGKYGVMYELLQFKTVSGIIRENPGKTGEVIRKYVKFLNEIHDTPVNNFPNAKESFKSIIMDKTKGLIDEEHEQSLWAVFDDVPDGKGFIHGDPHFANLFKTEDGLMFVDLDSAKHGNEIWDMVALYCTLVTFRLISEADVLHLGSTDNYSSLWDMIFDEYISQNGLDRKEAERTIFALSYARALAYSHKHDKPEEMMELLRNKLYQALDE